MNASPSDRLPAVRSALHTIPTLIAAATALADGSLVRGRFTSDRVTGRSHDAPPSPSPAWDEIDTLRAWAAEWADTAAAVLDHPDLRHSLWTIGTALTYLDTHLEALLHSGVGPELARDVEATALRLTLLAGLEEHRARLDTPCPRCDRRSLVQADGTGLVECTAVECRACWERPQYDALLTAVTAAMRSAC